MCSPRPCVLEQDAVWVEPRPAKQGCTLQCLHTTVSRFCAGAAHTRLAKLHLVVRRVVALIGHARSSTAMLAGTDRRCASTVRELAALHRANQSRVIRRVACVSLAHSAVALRFRRFFLLRKVGPAPTSVTDIFLVRNKRRNHHPKRPSPKAAPPPHVYSSAGRI